MIPHPNPADEHALQDPDGEHGPDDGDPGGEAGGGAEQVQHHQGQDHHRQQTGKRM